MLTSFVLFLIQSLSSSLILDEVYTIEDSIGSRFDLSGLLFLSEESKAMYHLEAFDLVLVNDRSSWIYRGRLAGKQIHVEPWILIRKDWGVRHDFEDIASDGKKIFVLNEGDGSIIELVPNAEPKLIHWPQPKNEYSFTDWFGAEALLVQDGFWIFREMPPLAAFQLKGKKVKSYPGPREGSQTSARWNEDGLFVLDRDLRCIWRSNSYVDSQRECLSFAEYVDRDKYYRYQVRDSEGKLHPEWSTAEALDIQDGKFWVGLDNNAEGLYRDLRFRKPIVLQLRDSTK